MFGLKPSKNLSLKLARLVQSVKRFFTVFARLWHSWHSSTGRPSIKYQWVSNVWPALSLIITVSPFLHLLLYIHGGVSNLISLSLSPFSFHMCSIFYVWRHYYMETGVDRGMLSSLPTVLTHLLLFYLRFSFLENLRVKVSSRFPLLLLISVGWLWCVSVVVLLGWSEFDFEALVGSFLNLLI